MMRVRGGFFCLFAVVLVVAGGSVGSVPSHKWFDEAEVDLYSLTGLVDSAVFLCDEALYWSLQVNCTIGVNDSISFSCSWSALNESFLMITSLDKLLFFDLDDIAELSANSGSFDDVNELIVPLEWFSVNVSNFVIEHQDIVDGFSSLVNGSFSNGSSAQEILANLRTSISASRRFLDGASKVLDIVAWEPESSLLGKIENLYELLNRYDEFVEDFVYYFPGGTPLITLFTVDAEVVLFERIELFGYCMAGSRFLENKTVWLFHNGVQIGSVIADSFGRYEGNVSVNDTSMLGNHVFFSQMRYDGEGYDSDEVEVHVDRIPLFVDVEMAPRHVFINESIRVFGSVVDYRDREVDCEGQLIIENMSFGVIVDDGLFSQYISIDRGFGKYSANFVIDQTEIYSKAISEDIVFFIDTPTVLLLQTHEDTVSVDDDVVLVGSLTDGLNKGPLVNKSVNIIVGNSIVGSTITNEFGAFRYVFATKSLGAGEVSFYASYLSDEVQWRSSISDSVLVNLQVTFVAYVPVVVLFLVVICFFVVLWVARDRISQLFGQVMVQKDVVGAISEGGRPRLRFARRIGRAFQRISRGVRMTQDAMRDAVFVQYRLLLRFLAAEGVMIGPTDTHIDLQRRMVQQGYPVAAVERVTETFEQAMYSPYPMSYEQLLAFDQGVFQLMTRREM